MTGASIRRSLGKYGTVIIGDVMNVRRYCNGVLVPQSLFGKSVSVKGHAVKTEKKTTND